MIDKGNDNYYLMATSPTLGQARGERDRRRQRVEAPMAPTLATGAWTHLAFTLRRRCASPLRRRGACRQQGEDGNIAVSTGALTIGGDPFYGQYFEGSARRRSAIYGTALTRAQIQSDMATPVGGGLGPRTPPTVSITSPAGSVQVSDIVNVTARRERQRRRRRRAVLRRRRRRRRRGHRLRPYGLSWDTRTVANGAHTLTARRPRRGGNATRLATASR